MFSIEEGVKNMKMKKKIVEVIKRFVKEQKLDLERIGIGTVTEQEYYYYLGQNKVYKRMIALVIGEYKDEVYKKLCRLLEELDKITDYLEYEVKDKINNGEMEMKELPL